MTDDPGSLILTKLQVGCGRAVSSTVLRHAKFNVCESLGEELSIQLTSYVATLGKQKIDIDIRYPEDWWQAFRDRWFPRWYLSRRPSRFVHKEVHESVFKAVCPHLDLDDKAIHVQWLAIWK